MNLENALRTRVVRDALLVRVWVGDFVFWSHAYASTLVHPFPSSPRIHHHTCRWLYIVYIVGGVHLHIKAIFYAGSTGNTQLPAVIYALARHTTPNDNDPHFVDTLYIALL